jgi:preprotein translocase subunit YajC
MQSVLITSGIIIFVTVFYMAIIRPWQHRWGATDEEVLRSMPGDELVQNPSINATRAVTVNARPGDIWPWIVQIGFGKAGWYSYDIIDNLGRPSADYINPEWQNLKPGDKIFLSSWTYNTVKEMNPFKSILWTGGDSAATDGTWAWGLYPVDENHTRLITRMRGRYDWKSPWIILLLLVDTFDIIMMRKCMLGIKKRAESAAK